MPVYRSGGMTHVQSEPSNEWTINHGLGRQPAVSVSIHYQDKLQVVLPREIQIVNDTQVVVRFTNPQTGEARLV